MKEFLPWSIETYNVAAKKYCKGRMSILDVQLSGKCNLDCIYCDSPDRNLLCEINFDHLANLVEADKETFDWLFVCGLGEPLWAENREALLSLLKMCEQLNIKCSIFTNGSQIDESILEYIYKGILCPIVKIDTFSFEKSVQLYGTQKTQKNLDAIKTLFNIGKKNSSNYCTIAASIVPTTLNKAEILDIVKQCLAHNVFPLIGQLEKAGKVINNTDNLLLSKDELIELKQQIGDYIGEEYRVPICPSVIAGIHILHDGWISVDHRSGLSCSWFWLEDPYTKKLRKLNELKTLREADTAIIGYRNSVYDEMAHLASEIEEYPFGGCGGNVKSLAEAYVKLHKSLLINKETIN